MYRSELRDLLQDEQHRDIDIRLAKDQLLEYGKITKGRYKYCSQLYVKDDLVTKSGRVFVPASLRFQITSQVHNRNHWGYITTYNNIAKSFIGLVRENITNFFVLSVMYV